jgi:hypothetical protein
MQLHLFSLLQARWNVKIIIGVTKEPERIKEYLSQHRGQDGTLTEIGPFLSRMDALNWLVYLKSRIADFEEIIPESQSGRQALWYGFTFEQLKSN